MVEIERVIEIIREELCIDDEAEINGDTKLRQDLEMDSLDTVSLISALEDEYDINKELNYTDLVSVNDVVNMIKNYLEEN